MRYFLIFFCLVVLLCPFCAFASDVSSETFETEPEVLLPVETSPSDDPIVSEEIVRSVSPVTPNDATGLKKVLLQLFGSYDTIVTEYRYTTQSGYSNGVSIDIQEDWPWIISAALFTIIIYCLFRLLGGVLCGRK